MATLYDAKPYPTEPPPPQMTTLAQVSEWVRRLWDGQRGLRQGKFNNQVGVLISASSTVTRITNPMLTRQSLVIFSPLNAEAQDLYEAGMFSYLDDRHDGYWDVRHANKPHVDMMFQVVVFN